ncbi:RNA-binding protein 7, partial [Callorhinchus milii]
QAGPLTKVTIPKDKDGRQKSYGFVCFKHTESVPYAISLLNGIRLYGRPLNLQYRSGSSHTADTNVSYPGSDNSLCRTAQDKYNLRSSLFQDTAGSSLFLTPPYSVNSNYSNPNPSYWQAMVNTYTLQQYHINAHLAQQQQQQQQLYYQALSQELGTTPLSASYFNSGTGLSQAGWGEREPEEMERDRGKSDNGANDMNWSSGSEADRNRDGLRSGHREHHHYKKHKSKKKKH